MMTQRELQAIVHGMAPVLHEHVTKAATEARLQTALELTKECSALRERIATLEARAPIPGPPGTDGVNGKDGADGLGFDELDLIVDDARKGCFLRFARGEQVKEFRLPIPFDVGKYAPGEHFYKGNVVSFASSWWIAKAPTSDKPGEGATAWRLTVKKPQDGRDGKDGRP